MANYFRQVETRHALSLWYPGETTAPTLIIAPMECGIYFWNLVDTDWHQKSELTIGRRPWSGRTGVGKFFFNGRLFSPGRDKACLVSMVSRRNHCTHVDNRADGMR